MADKRPPLTQRPSAAQADQWVHGSEAPQQPPAAPAAVSVEPPVREPTRRLTLDIPERLHRKMKIKAATTGVPIVAEATKVLEAHYVDE